MAGWACQGLLASRFVCVCVEKGRESFALRSVKMGPSQTSDLHKKTALRKDRIWVRKYSEENEGSFLRCKCPRLGTMEETGNLSCALQLSKFLIYVFYRSDKMLLNKLSYSFSEKLFWTKKFYSTMPVRISQKLYNISLIDEFHPHIPNE